MEAKPNFWKPTLTNWREVDKDALKFIFEQADKYAKYTLDVGNRITDRAYALILFLFPLLSICVAALIVPTTRQQFSTLFVICIFLVMIVLTGCLVLLIRIIFPRLFTPYGRAPKQITISQFLENPKWDESQTVKFLYLNEISNCQGIIDQNEAQNSARIKKLKICMTTMLGLFCTVVILLIIYVAKQLWVAP